MNQIQMILLVLIALAGIPAGLFIASRTKEELKAGKKWFKLIILFSAIGMIFALIFSKGDQLAYLISSLAFLFFLALMPLVKKFKGR